MSHLRIVASLTLSVATAGACGTAAETAGSAQSPNLSPSAARGTASTPDCGTVPGHDMAVFVGRRLDVQKIEPDIPPGTVLMDEVFRARYQVLQVVCGELPTPEVEFEVADHYGRPTFESHQTVLLFLSRDQSGWYHEKYQYFDVYETADGGWASCGDPYRFDHSMHHRSVAAQPITFKRHVSFPLEGLTEEQIGERYPRKFFERQGDRVVCRLGARVPELFAVKRDGVLKARGLFR